jgi:hypothetical protein
LLKRSYRGTVTLDTTASRWADMGDASHNSTIIKVRLYHHYKTSYYPRICKPRDVHHEDTHISHPTTISNLALLPCLAGLPKTSMMAVVVIDKRIASDIHADNPAVLAVLRSMATLYSNQSNRQQSIPCYFEPNVLKLNIS